MGKREMIKNQTAGISPIPRGRTACLIKIGGIVVVHFPVQGQFTTHLSLAICPQFTIWKKISVKRFHTDYIF